jgi:multiple sugar transport system permease protein
MSEAGRRQGGEAAVGVTRTALTVPASPAATAPLAAPTAPVWDEAANERERRNARLRKAGGRAVLYAVAIGFALFAALPFAWMILTVFKQNTDLYDPNLNPFLFNQPPTLASIQLLFERTQYLTFVRNTLVVSVLVVLITLVGAVPAAYSLSRLAGRWGEGLGIAIFLVYLVPPTLLFIPLSRVVSDLSLRNTWWAMVVVYPTFTIPFCTWLLMGFFKSIPRDIEEQAMVDGYSRLGAIWRTVLPVSLPGLLTVVVFSFALTMHEFVYALAFVTSSQQKTISIGVTTELIRGDVYFWQSLMAAAALVAIPVALLYNIFLDRFIAGFTLGAVKG